MRADWKDYADRVMTAVSRGAAYQLTSRFGGGYYLTVDNPEWKVGRKCNRHLVLFLSDEIYE